LVSNIQEERYFVYVAKFGMTGPAKSYLVILKIPTWCSTYPSTCVGYRLVLPNQII